jgi:hypothetical protein
VPRKNPNNTPNSRRKTVGGKNRSKRALAIGNFTRVQVIKYTGTERIKNGYTLESVGCQLLAFWFKAILGRYPE